MKRVLLIAFHFPPFSASSGIQRPLSLARYLPGFGWEPTVLTTTASAYDAADPASLATLPGGLSIVRAPALDAARHLSIGGRYPNWLGVPDRWNSWLATAIPAGLALIRRQKPDIIWSTYPLATAHHIGMALHRLTGVPWVADFRDPMVERIGDQWFPEDPSLRNARLRVERRVAQYATATTFCTGSARRIYLDRHLARQPAQIAEVIANGFDPGPFARAEGERAVPPGGRLTLVHSGTLYPGPDRDPVAFLEALCRLEEVGKPHTALRVVLRATGFDDIYRPIIERLGLANVVELAPSIGYQAALREMLDADGLLLFQGHTSNPAVPAKVYEYLRACRPILALADEAGETADLLRRAGVGRLLPIDDVARIEVGLRIFLKNLAAGTEPVLAPPAADPYSRVHRVAEFATLFTRLAVG